MTPSDYKQLRFRVHPDTHAMVTANAERRGESIAEYCRNIIEKEVIVDAAEDGIDHTTKIIREVLESVLQPHIERLAKINAKTNLQAGTALYILLDTLEIANVDIQKALEEGRKRAVADLQARGD